MALPNLSIPSISISLADDPPVHSFDAQPPSEDDYRSSFLSPPPIFSPRSHRQHSPLRPTDTGNGLDPGHFEALLASTRERNACTKKEPNLRKELAMKAHKSKQMERRALFLSKVNAPPSPTATALPKTPPDSPAILHYTLPSPGLDSPLALFESLQQTDPTGPVQYPSIEPWVEHVQYRQVKGSSARPPSLEQITAHLSSHGHSTPAKDEYHRLPIPLPTFLRPHPRMKAARSVSQHYVVSAERTDGGQKLEVEITPPIPGAGELFIPLPKTHAVPTLPLPGLLVTTTTIQGSQTALTEVNLSARNSRSLTGRDMMSKLKRRLSGLPSADDMGGCSADEDERRARRISAPAELPKRERDGFAHLILARPGAF